MKSTNSPDDASAKILDNFVDTLNKFGADSAEVLDFYGRHATNKDLVKLFDTAIHLQKNIPRCKFDDYYEYLDKFFNKTQNNVTDLEKAARACLKIAAGSKSAGAAMIAHNCAIAIRNLDGWHSYRQVSVEALDTNVETTYTKLDKDTDRLQRATKLTHSVLNLVLKLLTVVAIVFIVVGLFMNNRDMVLWIATMVVTANYIVFSMLKE